MEIKLSHDDLVQAIGNHLVMMGINIEGKDIDFKFHRGRGSVTSTSASIIITDVRGAPAIALLTTEAIDSTIEAAAELLEQPLAEVKDEIEIATEATEEVLDDLQDEDDIDAIFKEHG